MSFKIGDKIVYPNHGVTIVEGIGISSLGGTPSTCYDLRLLANDSRLMVPVANTERVGLRRLYHRNQIRGLLTQLEVHTSAPHSDWKGRYRDNLERMKTGKLEDVADVLKNLTEVARRKSLSFREKKMYDRARYLLVSEIAIVKEIPETDAEQLVDVSLTKCLEVSH